MEDKVFELLTKMYSEMTVRFEAVENKLATVENKLATVENKLDEKADKSDIVRLENELTPRIEALFDGYKQHTDILERIEKKVANQDEIIMRRIK